MEAAESPRRWQLHLQAQPRDSAPTPLGETLARAVPMGRKPQGPTLTFFWQLTVDPNIKSTVPCIATFPGESQSSKDQYFHVCKNRGWTILLRPDTRIIKAEGRLWKPLLTLHHEPILGVTPAGGLGNFIIHLKISKLHQNQELLKVTTSKVLKPQ